MTVELRHLRAFAAIATEQNLARAAATLHVTQPALSRTLAQLEREVGILLVDRSTHHCSLTPAGEQLALDVADALHAVDAALARAAGLEPPLRLGHTWSAGTYLADIVRAWNAATRPCELVVTRSTIAPPGSPLRRSTPPSSAVSSIRPGSTG